MFFACSHVDKVRRVLPRAGFRCYEPVRKECMGTRVRPAVFMIRFDVFFVHALPISCNAFFPCQGAVIPRAANVMVSRHVHLQVLLLGVMAIALMGFLHLP